MVASNVAYLVHSDSSIVVTVTKGGMIVIHEDMTHGELIKHILSNQIDIAAATLLLRAKLYNEGMMDDEAYAMVQKIFEAQKAAVEAARELIDNYDLW